jgi:hypothetical protein
VTDEKGRFEIGGIPPGEYDVRFWHEGWKVTPRRDAEGRIEQYVYSADIAHTETVAFKPGETRRVKAFIGEAAKFRVRAE